MILLRIMGTLPGTLATPDDNQRWWIAGNPLLTSDEHTQMSEDGRTIQRQSANQSGPGWPFQKKTDTGNETLTLNFSTSRTFASPEEAWNWRNEFSSLSPTVWPHPIAGDCVMRFLRANGTFSEARLYDCLLAKPQMKANGTSIELSYTLTGGRIEPGVEGQDVIPIARDSATVALKLFGTSVGGAFTDAATLVTGSIATTLSVGATVQIQAVDNIGSLLSQLTFEVVSGGAPSPGNIAVTHPFASNLATIVTAFAEDDHIVAEFVDDTRDYAHLFWVTPATGALDEVRISVIVDNGVEAYEGTTTAEDTDPTAGPLSYPVDDNGDIPIADTAV